MDLKNTLLSITPERIIILHLKGIESIHGLRNATELLASFGSQMIEYLTPDSSWVWVYISGGKTLIENVINIGYTKSQPQTLLHFIISLSEVKNKISENKQEKDRWNFCAKYGAMTNLCDESDPANLSYTHLIKFENPRLKSIPVIVTSGKRTHYLYQSLVSFFRAFGVVKSNIHVLGGENSLSVIKLLELLNITFTYISPSTYKEDRFISFLYYKEVYRYVLNLYGDSKYIIFLEEDVKVSRDFFSYISQTVHLLDKDPSLYCVTGFSSVGFKNLAYDESVLLRGETQVGWGYAVKPSYIEEALLKWNLSRSESLTELYDGWMFYNVRGRRECIFPEVSRASHYGLGTNTNFWISERYFFTSPLAHFFFNKTFMNIDRLELTKWKQDLRQKISLATPIRDNPCQKDFLKTLQPGSYVIFYDIISSKNNFGLIGACFHTWIYSQQGQHNLVSFVKPLPNIMFYLVGCPNSSFSDIRPKSYPIFEILKEPLKEQAIYYDRYNFETNRLEFKARNLFKNNMVSLFNV